MSEGLIKVVAGCMSCAKSEETFRDLRLWRDISGLLVILFKHKLDIHRTPGNEVKNRRGETWPAIVIEKPVEALAHVNSGHKVVAFDDIQFFDHLAEPSLAEVIYILKDRGIQIIANGLDKDFKGLPFETTAMIVCIAHEKRFPKAVCQICRRIHSAEYSQRLLEENVYAPYDDPRFMVGGLDRKTDATDEHKRIYEPRCPGCYVRPENPKLQDLLQ